MTVIMPIIDIMQSEYKTDLKIVFRMLICMLRSFFPLEIQNSSLLCLMHRWECCWISYIYAPPIRQVYGSKVQLYFAVHLMNGWAVTNFVCKILQFYNMFSAFHYSLNYVVE